MRERFSFGLIHLFYKKKIILCRDLTAEAEENSACAEETYSALAKTLFMRGGLLPASATKRIRQAIPEWIYPAATISVTHNVMGLPDVASLAI